MALSKPAIPTADQLLADGITDLVAVLERESDHEGIKVRSRWEDSTDRWAIQVRCAGCGKEWLRHHSGTELARHKAISDLVEFYRVQIIPFFQQITRESCYSLKDGALLAEWLTERLVSAGSAGLPYPQIVHEASDARLAPPQDVDMMLRKLGFLAEWVRVRPLVPKKVLEEMKNHPEWKLPIVRLPVEHPRCNWKEEDVDGHSENP